MWICAALALLAAGRNLCTGWRHSLLGSAGVEMISGAWNICISTRDLDLMYSVSADVVKQLLQTQNIEWFHTKDQSNRKECTEAQQQFPSPPSLKPVVWQCDKAARCVCLRGDSRVGGHDKCLRGRGRMTGPTQGTLADCKRERSVQKGIVILLTGMQVCWLFGSSRSCRAGEGSSNLQPGQLIIPRHPI